MNTSVHLLLYSIPYYNFYYSVHTLFNRKVNIATLPTFLSPLHAAIMSSYTISRFITERHLMSLHVAPNVAVGVESKVVTQDAVDRIASRRPHSGDKRFEASQEDLGYLSIDST
ncbi:hypothetical protein Trydic_g17343 [Trypoxylus dichotomus]